MLKPNYITARIVSNVLEKDVVNFEPLDGNEFGILINKIFAIVINVVSLKFLSLDGLQIICLALIIHVWM